MTDKQEDKTGPESLFADWIKTITASWESMASTWTSAAEIAGSTMTSKEAEKKSRVQKSWETTQKTWQALSSVMIEPETMETFVKGTGALPEIFLKMARTGMNSFVHLQQQWLEKAGEAGESTKAYKLEDFDEDAFKAWTELYEKEFRQFFNIPQLGLTRFYQEKMIRSIDKFNIFQVTLVEFLRLLSLPMEKSYHVMQEKLAELAGEGQLPEDSRAYYQMWIKILEGHYMTLFQSHEYTRTLNKTLDSLSEFSIAKKEVLQDFMNMLPVPTQKEMDELYKEIYLLKKRIKALEKKK